MCGICGFVGYEDTELLNRMTSRLTHRGPDEEGYFRDGDIGLGHRRLAIIDLKTGRQPIYNEDGSIVVVSNSEIYNYKELKDELLKKGHIFKTSSDTEVIVHGYEKEGISFVHKLVGMFAFALWDARKKTLILVRDRLGIKPLHYTQIGNKLLFASEIKSLLECEEVARNPNFKAIDGYLTFRYVPASETFFKGIYELPAGHMIKFNQGNLSLERYWKPFFHPEDNRSNWPFLFDKHLQAAVTSTMVSDVPVGVFLSGGLDSSAILAYACRVNSQKIHTFTIGLGGRQDELQQARAVARYYNTEHHETILEPRDIELLPKIVWYLDAPYGDADIIGIYKLSEMTSMHVKCVMTGDGADELLGGYIHQRALGALEEVYHYLPLPIFWQLCGLIVNLIPLGLLQKGFHYPDSLGIDGRKRLAQCLGYIPKIEDEYLSLASIFNGNEKECLYSEMFKEQLKEENLDIFSLIHSSMADIEIGDFFNRLIAHEFKFWLPNMMLCKQDKIAMAHSLELRFPFLDHRLVEFSGKIPVALKRRYASNKFILRESAAKYLPTFVTKRQKHPFHISIRDAFGERLDEKFRRYLDPVRIKKRGLLNIEYINKLLKNTNTLSALQNKRLMSLLMLEVWFDIFIDNNSYA